MNICVTGGAGYIGSVVVECLLNQGHTITILDNMNTGHRNAIASEATFVEGDIRDVAALERAIALARSSC